jgi:thiol-disulfide isomerase/thioredoxin
MKKVIVFALLSFLSIPGFRVLAQEVIISGTINNAEGKTIYLEGFDKASRVMLDSVVIKKKGKFVIKRKITTTDFYVLSIQKTDFFVLILQPGEKVTLEADGNNLSKTYQVKGSEHSQYLKDFVKIVNDYVRVRDSLQVVVRDYASKGDQVNASKVNMQMNTAYEDFQKKRDKFIDDHPSSPALLGVLSHLNQKQDIDQLRKIEKALAASMPGSQYHESVKASITQYDAQKAEQEKMLREKEMVNMRMAPGQPAPEISMNDRDGKLLPLSSLRGKYVLIDFWASWCGPCRKENPNVVRAYTKYKDSGFTVYSVSIDTDKEKWLAAIIKDQLTWINHVSSLQGWNTPILRDYGINGIPFTVLIDKEGKIIQTNLRGSALDQKLMEIFGF